MPILPLLTLILSLLVATNCNALSLPQDEDLAQQRKLFILASKDINRRHYSDARQKIRQLDNYPLIPYLEYQLLLKKLSQKPIAEIDQFLIKYSALPMAKRLRLKALTAKAKYRHWQDVLALYRDGDGLAAQCNHLRAVYHKVGKKAALDQVEQLWLTGNSLPKACDSLLAAWKSAGYQTTDLLWQRIELALISRQSSLAKYLARSLPKKSAKEFKYWYRLYLKPKKLQRNHYWTKTGNFATTILKIATERLIYQAPKTALKIWPTISSSNHFSSKMLDQLTNKLALKLIVAQHPKQQLWLDKLNWVSLNKSQQDQILRALVAQSRWQQISQSYHKNQQQQQPDLGWQYWYAVALEHLDQEDQARTIFQNLAKRRRYYGFLASDKLQQPYHFNHRALDVDPTSIKSMKVLPALMRAQELLQLKRFIEARREWYHLLKSLNEAQRLAAAFIADSWQWHDRAIITLTMTEQRDDLNIRFPMPYFDVYQHEARVNKIALSWPLAISRQESAFMANARSHAGAMGLMQLLPDTAKQQAKISKISYRKKSQLLTPAFNIKLGTGYLSQMLDKFDNNIAVAAAAYNAGPHRVKHWVNKNLPQDQWIETIPYRETRNYVKNILAYAAIYQHHLHQRTTMPSAMISPAQMKIINAD